MRPKLEYLKPSELVPYERNARTHSYDQIEQIKASIAEFGFTNPVLIDLDGVIIAGHGRATAAKEMGLEAVPVIRLGDLTQEQVKALRIADNQLALNAGWDEELLRIELSELEDFDLDILGFSLDELDALVYSLDTLDEGVFHHPSEESEEIFIEPSSSPVSRPGDVCELGPHRLLCGDSTKLEHVSEVMAGAPAALYLTDPPYNVSYTGGSTKERRAIANDSMPAASFEAFLASAFTAANAHMSPGSALYLWHASKALLEFVSACEAAAWPVRQTLIWVKNSFTLGRQDYQWRHEPCLYGWKPGAAHRWYGDRSKSTVLEFPKPQKSDLHPTMKPVALFEHPIENSTELGDVVLDGFAGSGTTVIACERLGRVARAIEFDPAYCDVIVERWERETGKKAKRVEFSSCIS